MPEIIEKVVAAIRPKPDAKARLAVALAKFRALQDALHAIRKRWNARTDVERFEDYRRECSERFKADPSFKNEFDLAVAGIVLKHEREKIGPDLLAKQLYGVGNEETALNELFHQYRDWREVIKEIATIQLEIARQQTDEVEKSVRADLLGHGFSEDQIEQHPKLSRARDEVKVWKSLAQRCDTDRDDSALWKSAMWNFRDLTMA